MSRLSGRVQRLEKEVNRREHEEFRRFLSTLDNAAFDSLLPFVSTTEGIPSGVGGAKLLPGFERAFDTMMVRLKPEFEQWKREPKIGPCQCEYKAVPCYPLPDGTYPEVSLQCDVCGGIKERIEITYNNSGNYDFVF